MEGYSPCRLCPRQCNIDRTLAKGFCNEKSTLHVSRASLHMWEEPCISGKNGSGTVFFSGCNMGCVFCQNYEISRGRIGKNIDIGRLVEIFFELKKKGANNINLVTGDIFIPTIRIAIEKAKSEGFDLPFLMNTSSYITVDTLKSLEGLIDIYLPDMKYIRESDAVKYSNSPGYPEAAKAAIAEMVRQQPECIFTQRDAGDAEAEYKDDLNDTAEYRDDPEDEYDSGRLIKKGVIVRHLLLPGMLIQAKLIVRYLYQTYGDSIYISLMNQFTPDSEKLSERYPEINRKVTEYEYKSLVDYAAELGVTNGFIQVGETAEESFIPAFDLTGV
ncbi:MAG: radical SAM protein [Eubacterium sp.]|nr:radical SAM protein [Eubacterium sp.]